MTRLLGLITVVIASLVLSSCGSGGGGGDSAPAKDPAIQLSVSASGNSWVRLEWAPGQGQLEALTYTLHYNTDANRVGPEFAESTAVTPNNIRSHTLGDLVNGTTYYFRVTSDSLEDEPSAVVAATPLIPAPSGLNVLSSDGSVTLSWAAVAGAEQYAVYVVPPNTDVNTVSPLLVSETTLVVPGLNNGTMYSFALRSLDGRGGQSSISQAQAAVPGMQTPQALSASSGDGQVSLSWAAQAGVASYNVYYSTSPDVSPSRGTKVTVSNASATIAGLENGKVYYFLVSAAGEFESAPSLRLTVVPGINAPNNVVATPGNGEIHLSWDSVSGATQYNVYYCDKNRDAVRDGSCVVTSSTSMTIKNLRNRQMYHVAVSAEAAYESADSTMMDVMPLNHLMAPTNLLINPGDGEVFLEWDEVPDAVSYNVYYSTSLDISATTGMQHSTILPIASISGLTNDVEYYFVVTAVEEDLTETAESYIVSTIPYERFNPEVPPVFDSIVAGNRQISLTWNPVLRAELYHIYYGTSAGVTKTNSSRATTTNTFITLNNLVNGSEYFFVIAAQCASEGVNSPESSATPSLTAPLNFSAQAGNASVFLDWSAVANATGYRIYYSTSPNVDPLSATMVSAANAPALLTGFSNGITYHFALSAIDAVSESPLSIELLGTPIISTPSNPQVSAGDTSALVSFSTVSGASSYKVYYGTSSGVNSTSPTSVQVSGSPAMISGLTNGTPYYFVVSALDAGSESPTTAELSATPIISTPASLLANAGDTSVSLNFAQVAGATSYKIYYGTSAGVNKASPNSIQVSGSPAVVSGLTNGTTYYFVATALDAGSESFESLQVSATPVISLPQSPSVTAGNASASVSFDPVSGATSYKVYYGSAAGVSKASATSASGITSPIVVTGLTNGTPYFFVVTALDGGSESSESVQVTTTPLLSVPQSVSASAGDTNASVSFASVSGATSYKVYYSTSAGVTTSAQSFSGTSSPIVISGLTNGTAYFFALSAIDANSESALSSEVSATPIISAPSAPQVSAGDTNALVSFSGVAGATSYKVYYSNSSGVNKSSPNSVQVSGSPAMVSGLSNGTPYYFVVSALDAGSESAETSELSATPVISTPTSVQANQGDTNAMLTFASVSGATSYKIYYATATGVSKASPNSVQVSGSPSTISGLTNGTAYYFVVTALDAGSESAESTQVSATPVISVPQNPSVMAGDTTASVSFDAVNGATSYKVYYATASGVSKASANSATALASPISITGLTNGSAYFFVVTALDAGSESSESTQVTTTPLISIPQMVSLSVGHSTASVSFGSVSGATSYKVYYST
ncbi:MAG: fibronectin type III domain-containing protein, partial [Planctomycetes bacterium]|nr:fibronectin type III domain-containing protein [Planctomycetota bacterium]